MPRYRVGVDVGGTFTDIVAVEEGTGRLVAGKVPSTPGDESVGVMDAFKALDIEPKDVAFFGHGFTVGINAVLTRTGAKTGLLTTEGHRDYLDIGRMHRPWGKYLYDPTWMRPHVERPLVERRYRRGIPERLAWDGSELVALDEEAVRQEVGFLRREGVEAIGVCFINSYLNLEHERRVEQIIRDAFPEAYVSTSAIHPVVRETDRTTTVALSAYIGPKTSNYLDILGRKLRDAGFEGDVLIMQVNGGFATLDAARSRPIYTIISGPVAGVLGAEYYSHLLGVPHIISLDMGGTSCDVGLVRDGRAVVASQFEIEHGIDFTIPSIEVKTIGAGGGSIISVDKVGSLRVGPESAGADPGPACYGRGGGNPTLTDAYVLTGIVRPELFLGGRFPLRPELAEESLQRLADRLHMDLIRLASGAMDLATSNMAETVRGISIYRGLDAREFQLLVFGAAGGIHGTRIAKSLSIPTVLVPQALGGFSAASLLTVDMRTDYAESLVRPLDELGPEGLEASFRRLEKQATKDLERQGIPRRNVRIERYYYGMYTGQTWDNRNAAPNGRYDQGTFARLKQQFHDNYIENFGYKAEELPIIVTTTTVTAVGPLAKAELSAIAAGSSRSPREALLFRAPVYLEGKQFGAVPFFERDRLLAGNVIKGPAVIDERLATTVLYDGDVCRVDERGILHITVG